MALVHSGYEFIFADIGGQGRISDVGVFKHSSLWEKIDRDILNFPTDSPLPGRDIDVSYTFLGYTAFALHKRILKPFLGNHDFGTMERTYHSKHSATRVIVENMFEVLLCVFRFF